MFLSSPHHYKNFSFCLNCDFPVLSSESQQPFFIVNVVIRKTIKYCVLLRFRDCSFWDLFHPFLPVSSRDTQNTPSECNYNYFTQEACWIYRVWESQCSSLDASTRTDCASLPNTLNGILRRGCQGPLWVTFPLHTCQNLNLSPQNLVKHLQPLQPKAISHEHHNGSSAIQPFHVFLAVWSATPTEHNTEGWYISNQPHLHFPKGGNYTGWEQLQFKLGN